MRKGSLLLMVLMAFAALPAAMAVPITYTLTGYVQASGNGQNVNASFVWTATGDTTGLTTSPVSAGTIVNPAITSTITINGVVTDLVLTNVSVGLNTSTGVVNFGSATGGLGLTATALKTWDLVSPIGPVTGTGFIIKGTIMTPDGTTITLSGVTPPAGNNPMPSFQAAFPMPTISSVQNAGSNLTFNNPLAPGEIFVVKGTGLGPNTLLIDPTPFQHTNLGGTSVTVTVGATQVNALIYYTSAGQVAALLPSNTPTGTATISVGYNNQNSVAVSRGVAPNSVGIFTVDSTGTGPGIVTYPDYSLVSAAKAANCGGPNTTCGAANPGDTLILWATGLGAITGSDSKGDGLGVAINAPLTLWLGGVQAPVIYQGRSGCCIGEDQIVFTVPATGVPTGCAVPLVVQIGTTANTVSNTVLMPVAAGGRNCTPNSSPLTAAAAYQLALAGPLKIGDIDIEQGFNNSGGYVDQAYFQFIQAGVQPGTEAFLGSYLDQEPTGTCVTYNTLNPNIEPQLVNFTQLDGGASMTIKGPNGSVNLPGPSGDLATFDATGKFITAGAFTVSGAGGKDVGAFSGTINIPALPTVTAPVGGSTIGRPSGLTVSWKGGDPASTLELVVTSATDNTFTTGGTAKCKVSGGAGTFTIPPYVLLPLLASSSANVVLGAAESDVAFTASGINVGSLHTQSQGTLVGLTLK